MTEDEAIKGPIAQEASKKHNMMWLGGDLFVEVSSFKGKVYGAIRRWFKADDGKYYRTKNGIHMSAVEVKEFISYLGDASADIVAFMDAEIANPWSE